MKIILAPDKFKGSLTGLEFCDTVSKIILKSLPDTEVVFCPLADGGDGTIDVVNFYLKGQFIQTTVHNPFFNKITASYLYNSNSQTAFIEMAEASGIKQLNPTEFDCKKATTLGVGELIIDAVNKNATTIILGIGGSATNDCGIGMATALGYTFLNKKHNPIIPIGANLSEIVTIDDSSVNPELKNINFIVACDVTNPLYGKQGAAYVYAKQKGASEKDIKLLDKGLKSFSKLLDSKFNITSQKIPGAGAAGGMGIAAKTFLNAQLISGIELIKKLADFNQVIKNSDWIITGEGQLDYQTLSGKTINGVIKDAKKQKINIAAFCGKLDLTKKDLKKFGISYADEIMNYTENLEDAIKNSKYYVSKISEKFVKKELE